jgi:transcriptional regulator with XRE-family HTH domain
VRRVYDVKTARGDTISNQPMPPRRTLVALPGVRYWRIKRMKLQRQLAEDAQIDIRSLQRIEAGGLAGLETLAKLAKALEVDSDDLLQEPPSPSN